MSGVNVGQARDGVLSIVLAGGKGSRLHDLTHDESKPALPIGPGARLVDFTLANVANSGLGDALVLTQYAPATLRQHVEQCWGSGADGCAFSVLDGEDHGPFEGTAHAVASVIAEIDRQAPGHVVVLGGDHLYQMDYGPFVDRHLACDADVTVGVVHVPLAQASGFGVLEAAADFRISAFVEKPVLAPEALDRPGHALASMGIYVFSWPVLRRMLLDMAGSVPELDFGQHVIPRLVAAGTAYAYALPGREGREPLWQDLGTLDAYHAVQRQIVDGSLALDPAWPIAHPGRPAAADHGTVGAGSALRNVVTLPGARIGRGVTLSDAIVMGDAVLPDHFDLDAAIARHGNWCTVSERGIRVISARALGRLEARQRRIAAPAKASAALRPSYVPMRERAAPVASAI
ncbi:MAG TPA: sugar phosphate nucleotidyltransferase [Novosphingobium sp.]|nr:sugar phosphate nucleotidyltransferase [Novosphingobium sp.]